ncbi:hypothetical protein GCM10027047_06810 [Rhodococcus aerolatus]
MPLETLSDDSRGEVVLDGAPIAFRLGGPGFTNLAFIAVADRGIPSYDQYPVGLGFADAISRVQGYASRPKSVMAVVSIRGGDGPRVNDTDGLNALARAISAPELTPDEAARVRAGAAVSMLGVPGRAAGSGYTKVAPLPDSGDGGNLRGLVRWNPGPKTYSFVPTTPRLIDTSALTTRRCDPAERDFCTGQNSISIDRVQTAADPRPVDTYSVQLPLGKRDGFQVLSLDSRTLALRTNDVIDADNAESGSTPLYAALQRAFDPGPSGGVPPLVVVQSIGRPKAFQGWQASGDLLQSAGGSRQALLALDGATGDATTPSSDYTFIGSTRAGAAAVQASGKLGQQGPVTGVLQPAHDTSYLPQVSTPDGGAATGGNLEQVRIDYQAPQAFPAVDAASEAYLGRAINLPGCADGATPPPGGPACSFRRLYVTGFDADWGDFAAKLRAVAPPSPPAPGFDATKAQLLTELGIMTQVKDFYVGLASRLATVAAAGTPNDLRKAGDAIVAAVTQTVKPASTGFFDAMKMVSAIMGVVTLVVPELKAAWGPFSAMYSLGSTIYGAAVTPDKPDNTLADAVKVQVANLGEQAQLSLRNGQFVPVQEGQVVAGDWGRLQSVSRLLGQGAWTLPPQDGGFAGDVERGLRTFFYKSVISQTYPLLLQVDPVAAYLFKDAPLPGSPQTMTCFRFRPFPFSNVADYFHPWQNLPVSASAVLTVAYQAGEGGQPVRRLVFPTIAGPVMDNPADDTNVVRNTLPAAVAQQAFGDDVDSGVRINPLEYFSPRYFPSIRAAAYGTPFCGLY